LTERRYAARRGADLRLDTQRALLPEHLGDLAGDLESGSVFVIEQARIRIRPLPISGWAVACNTSPAPTAAARLAHPLDRPDCAGTDPRGVLSRSPQMAYY